MGVSLRSDVTQEGAKSSICPEIDSYSTFGTDSLDPLTDSLDKGNGDCCLRFGSVPVRGGWGYAECPADQGARVSISLKNCGEMCQLLIQSGGILADVPGAV